MTETEARRLKAGDRVTFRTCTQDGFSGTISSVFGPQDSRVHIQWDDGTWSKFHVADMEYFTKLTQTDERKIMPHTDCPDCRSDLLDAAKDLVSDIEHGDIVSAAWAARNVAELIVDSNTLAAYGFRLDNSDIMRPRLVKIDD